MQLTSPKRSLRLLCNLLTVPRRCGTTNTPRLHATVYQHSNIFHRFIGWLFTSHLLERTKGSISLLQSEIGTKCELPISTLSARQVRVRKCARTPAYRVQGCRATDFMPSPCATEAAPQRRTTIYFVNDKPLPPSRQKAQVKLCTKQLDLVLFQRHHMTLM